MIFDPTIGSCAESSPAVSRIGRHISWAFGGDSGCSVDPHEVARAIEHFLDNDRKAEWVDTKTLSFLAAQAMASLGETDAARRLVVFGTGMVRPSEWIVTGGRTAWVFDLREMTIRDGAPLELLFFKSVQIVMEAMADVWDESRGDGVLGLRNVLCAASRLLCAPEDAARVAGLTAEIREMCASKLDQLRERRGWATTPSVLNLDL